MNKEHTNVLSQAQVGYVHDATFYDPEGCTCGQCESDNTHADDVGWFYVKDKALCLSCYEASGFNTCER